MLLGPCLELVALGVQSLGLLLLQPLGALLVPLDAAVGDVEVVSDHLLAHLQREAQAHFSSTRFGGDVRRCGAMLTLLICGRKVSSASSIAWTGATHW